MREGEPLMGEPMRVAQVLNRMESGGIEAVVMNYYRQIERDKVQFDFYFFEGSSFPQRQELEQLGAGIYPVPSYSRPFAYHRALYHAFKERKYQIVHAHLSTMSLFALFAAWRASVPVRICHNHSTAHWGEGKKTLLKYLLRPFNKVFATHYFACGEKAGRWMYGSRCFDKGNVHVMPNAIDTKHFAFCEDQRVRLREKLGIGSETPVLGHVGRYTYAKNHTFLLQCFATYLKQQPQARLLLIGEGECTVRIQQEVAHLQIGHAVIQVGPQKDSAPFYSVMDAFCLPSFYEGLPLVALEAQSNGLPCLFSKIVSVQACVLPHTVRLKLNDGVERWADGIAKLMGKRTKQAQEAMAATGFDIREQCCKLERFYLEQRRA